MVECVHQRLQQRRRAPDPVGQRGAGEVDAEAGVDGRLERFPAGASQREIPTRGLI